MDLGSQINHFHGLTQIQGLGEIRDLGPSDTKKTQIRGWDPKLDPTWGLFGTWCPSNRGLGGPRGGQIGPYLGPILEVSGVPKHVLRHSTHWALRGQPRCQICTCFGAVRGPKWDKCDPRTGCFVFLCVLSTEAPSTTTARGRHCPPRALKGHQGPAFPTPGPPPDSVYKEGTDTLRVQIGSQFGSQTRVRTPN